jgi:hypothetical protein
MSLLTIARWKQTGAPALDTRKPWFKVSGKPGQEKVGYLDDVTVRRNPGAIRTRNGKSIVRLGSQAKPRRHASR